MTFKILLLLLLNFVSCKESPVSIPKIEKDYAMVYKEAKAFCKREKFNEDYYFLIDLSIHSGRNRFFIYDSKTGKIANHNLVTHGSCDVLDDNETKWEQAKFSNANNSNCSAKGKYKIGKRDSSSWGIKVKYWLHGLEKSNNNAVQCVVVLHSWNAVSNVEVYPEYSPLSWGYPAVSDDFMRILDERLQKSDKPVLLWIIE